MDKIISKELLSEVLGGEYNTRLIDWFQMEENYLRTYYDCGKHDSKGRPTGLGIEINIHELTHKCILYAWDNFYEITPKVMGAEVMCLKTGYIVHTIDAEEIEKPEKFDPRYVYKACQWVYEKGLTLDIYMKLVNECTRQKR